MPVGIETIKRDIRKKVIVGVVIPVVYMWWAHTMVPIVEIDVIAQVMDREEQIGLWEDNIKMWEVMPMAGMIKMQTSGCPKIQKMCWYKTGSPPVEGRKKEVFKCLSVKVMVNEAAKIGTNRMTNNEVIKMEQVYKLCLFMGM